jgi:bifunctional DNA-binding transcriptional regulator/antitoxin component of YhaV-PrlF toxin-antitoxin module
METEQNVWLVTVDEEGFLPLPPELIDRLGWQVGDVLDFEDHPDGGFIIKNTTRNGQPEIDS